VRFLAEMVGVVISGNWLEGLELGNAIASVYDKKRKFAECPELCHTLFFPTVFEKHAVAGIAARLEVTPIDRGLIETIYRTTSAVSSPQSDKKKSEGTKLSSGKKGGSKIPRLDTNFAAPLRAAIQALPDSPLKETHGVLPNFSDTEEMSEAMKTALRNPAVVIPMLKAQLFVPPLLLLLFLIQLSHSFVTPPP